MGLGMVLSILRKESSIRWVRDQGLFLIGNVRIMDFDPKTRNSV